MLTLAVWLLTGWLAWGNLAGGGTGAGPAVTLTDSGSTVTIANGIISLLCTKSGATINQINYTYNNSGTAVTSTTATPVYKSKRASAHLWRAPVPHRAATTDWADGGRAPADKFAST